VLFEETLEPDPDGRFLLDLPARELEPELSCAGFLPVVERLTEADDDLGLARLLLAPARR